jgi:hypothetical protein
VRATMPPTAGREPAMPVIVGKAVRMRTIG